MATRREYDATILILTVALTCFGVLMVYSSSSVMAFKHYGDSMYFLKRQGLYALLGLGVLAISMRIDYHWWRRGAVALLLLSTLLLAAVFLPGIGLKAGGAARWIRFPGFSFQPSEAAKLALIFYLAHSATKKEDRLKDFKYGYVPYMVVLLVWLGLMLAQRDLGGAAIMACVTGLMLLVAGTRWRYVILSFLAAVPVLAFAILHEEYRCKRILAFLDPWDDPQGTGFQIIQSWMGFGLGGWGGAGLGEGQQKRLYLPEGHTDFIFSVIGEELGFVVVVLLICMFLCLVLMGLRIAMHTQDGFGRLTAFGISLLLGLQAFANMAVVMGLVPNKGLALPLISYGGSSLLCTLFGLGVLLNISSTTRSGGRGQIRRSQKGTL
ncbi:MAG: putative lipid II flippase FtsW [Desulfuromonadaceae bacterium]|nr:putative lipid II flippase FtsW [Desulfuromonadaceae bacterium]